MKSTDLSITEETKQIIDYIKEKTAMPAYLLEIQPNSKPSIFDSKFGGIPYWNPKMEYPTDSMGQNMIMIAQINFTQAALQDSRLPQEGILQFFIGNNDIFGADFDNPTVQTDFRIIYHEEINETITKENLIALGIPDCTDPQHIEFSPVFQECALQIQKTISYIGIDNVDFDKLFAEAVKKISHKDIKGFSPYQYFDSSNLDYLYDNLKTCGHQILGYPVFIQYDPRENSDYYNTLLLQIDSDMVGQEDYVLWGDCGVANFFINSEALKNKDFSQVWYNWDCS